MKKIIKFIKNLFGKKPKTTTSSTTTKSVPVYKFNQEIIFIDDSYFHGNGISINVRKPNPSLKFEYNNIDTISKMPKNMDIIVNDRLEMIVAFYEDYIGSKFRFTSSEGFVFNGEFIDGKQIINNG